MSTKTLWEWQVIAMITYTELKRHFFISVIACRVRLWCHRMEYNIQKWIRGLVVKQAWELAADYSGACSIPESDHHIDMNDDPEHDF